MFLLFFVGNFSCVLKSFINVTRETVTTCEKNLLRVENKSPDKKGAINPPHLKGDILSMTRSCLVLLQCSW